MEDFAQGLETLSTREKEVLKLYSLGKTNAEIGKQLEISERTVCSHTASIRAKLNCKNRTEVATQYVRYLNGY